MTNWVLHGDKKICYSEDFWTGKKTISINGEKLQKINKRTYQCGDNRYTIKGSYLTGVELFDGVQFVTLVRKLSTFEMILCFIPLLIAFVGGAIGGLCGGAACAFNAVFIRKSDKMIMKILYSVLSVIVAFVAYSILASVFLRLIGA